MRLTKTEVNAIIRAAEDVYGAGVSVYLFGSRTRDDLRGGDIDLMVRSRGDPKGVLAKVRLAARLKTLLGERKIDIIGDHEENEVALEVARTGILLK